MTRDLDTILANAREDVIFGRDQTARLIQEFRSLPLQKAVHEEQRTLPGRLVRMTWLDSRAKEVLTYGELAVQIGLFLEADFARPDHRRLFSLLVRLPDGFC